ncbi:MAG TPA: DUF2799 domain-containing protein [Burkholderiales bacterium]
MRCVLLLCIMLGACAPMTESQCRGADWAQLGERDGISGDRPRIEVYAHQCGQYNLRAAEKDYLDGWWLGNAEFERRTGGMDAAD